MIPLQVFAVLLAKAAFATLLFVAALGAAAMVSEPLFGD
jgi:hypothetical protein